MNEIAAKKVKLYWPVLHDLAAGGPRVEMTESPHGTWVSLQDHEAALHRAYSAFENITVARTLDDAKNQAHREIGVMTQADGEVGGRYYYQLEAETQALRKALTFAVATMDRRHNENVVIDLTRDPQTHALIEAARAAADGEVKS
jgi:hypothetical protein